jgi:hypothetical protein
MRPLLILGAAWDAAPLEFAIAGFDYATFYFTYTWDAGSVGIGAFDFQLETSPYAANLGGPGGDWFAQSLYAAGILGAGVDVLSRAQREYVTYQATAAGLGVAETFSRGPIRVAGAERIRMIARESGDIGLPGTLEIVAVFD